MGIGVEVVKKLMVQGYYVMVFDIFEFLENVVCWIKMDLNDLSLIVIVLIMVEGFYDVLINNVGLLFWEGLEEVIFGVNFFGFCSFLEGFLDKFSEGVFIVNVVLCVGV